MLRAAGLPLGIQGVWCPDFLPLLLWSLCLVTKEVRCVATGLRTNQDSFRGSEQVSAKASPSESTDPGREPEELIMDFKCQPEGLHFHTKIRSPWAQRTECQHLLISSGHLCPLFHTDIGEGFPSTPPPPSTWLMLQSNLESLNKKLEVNFRDY